MDGDGTINIESLFGKGKSMRKILCLTIFLALFDCAAGELASKPETIKCGFLEATLTPRGRIKSASFKGVPFMKNVCIIGASAGDGGRLFQGGNPPECVEKITVPAELQKENGNFVFSKEAVLGNSKHPEIIAYKMRMIFSEEDINIYYDIEYLQKLKWRFYGASIVFRLPEKMIAGRGWVSEMSEGSSVRAGHNPKEFKKENRMQWLWIDSGSRLCLETAVGKIQFAAEMPSYLRGGKDNIYVNSMPRDKVIAKGTKQKLNLKIILPKIKKERDAQ